MEEPIPDPGIKSDRGGGEEFTDSSRLTPVPGRSYHIRYGRTEAASAGRKGSMPRDYHIERDAIIQRWYGGNPAR